MKIDSEVRTSAILNERGIAFVVSLVTMLVLLILGYGLLVATDGSSRVENSMKAQTAAFETADSAIELAREQLRQCLAGTGSASFFSCNSKKTMSQMLAATGSFDSTTLSGFGSTTATTNGTGSTSFLASDSTTLSPNSFQVFLTNDPADGVATTLDGAIGTPGHNRVTLTSFASGPNNIGYAVVQSVVEAPLEGLDGLFQATLILPGPDVTFLPDTSNNYGIGNSTCNATIAVTSDTARNSVWSQIPTNRYGNYTTGGCAPSDNNHGVYNFLPSPSPYQTAAPNPTPPSNMPLASQDLITISWYNNYLLPKLSAVATFRSPSDAGFNLGTAANPQIVYINGDYDITGSGYGILVVTGNLTLHGNLTYTGLILNVGAGHTTVSGGGNGSVQGSLVVVNTTPWSSDSRYVSTPYYNANGGGTSAFGLGGNMINNVPFTAIASPQRISFMQLR